MALITKMRIHRFGGKEVLQADDVEPLLPDAVDGILPGAADLGTVLSTCACSSLFVHSS
jgi:hypothetical protein